MPDDDDSPPWLYSDDGGADWQRTDDDEAAWLALTVVFCLVAAVLFIAIGAAW